MNRRGFLGLLTLAAPTTACAAAKKPPKAPSLIPTPRFICPECLMDMSAYRDEESGEIIVEERHAGTCRFEDRDVPLSEIQQ